MRLRPTLAAWLLAGVAFVAGSAIALQPANRAVSEPTPVGQQAQRVLQGSTPLFFHVAGETWLPPVPVYANALARTLPISPVYADRLAGLMAGAVNVALVFLCAHAVAGTASAAFAASITLVLTFGHTSIALRSVDAIFPATLILVWLYAFLDYLKLDSPRALVLSMLALGTGVYSHQTGPLTSIFLWMLTIFIARRRNRWHLMAATVTFIALWLPAGVWFYWHPDTYADTLGRWLILKAHIRSPLDAFNAFLNPNTLGNRSSLYWGFWDPSWLFFRSPTGAPPPMLLFEAFLIVFALLRRSYLPSQPFVILIVSILIVPLAGSTFVTPHYIENAAGVLPVLAILSGLGFDQLVAVLTRRKPLEDDVATPSVDGWNDDEMAPRA